MNPFEAVEAAIDNALFHDLKGDMSQEEVIRLMATHAIYALINYRDERGLGIGCERGASHDVNMALKELLRWHPECRCPGGGPVNPDCTIHQ